ncbi:membrane protein insertase YidC [Wenzhouxiangella sediminis]|uniref:Membrane protein insertase YidC n=1 Tax=Wenzhouxiangella sediminis TaxID=1792836 RepID=A0A3E1K9E7_9GAMM|nr:membrane protein insertase YidC [Wenzhouxiangella sediminis]RFF30344.1 membrane protein insertase YidC [Wenzhouxiangella sediminis]
MNTRSFLLLLIGLLGFMVYLEWQKDYAPPPRPAAESGQQTVDASGTDRSAAGAGRSSDDPGDVPDVPDFADDPDASGNERSESADLPSAEPEVRASRRISIDTDVLNVDLDANGGTLVDLRLKDYPVSVDKQNEPFVLLVQDLPQLFVAQAGLVSADRPAPNHRTSWQFERDSYELQPGQDTLEVPLTWQHESGLQVVATWIFHRGNYIVDLEMEVINQSGETWQGARYVQLQKTRPDLSDAGWAFTNPERFSYNGAAVYSPEDALTKLGWDDMAEKPFQATFSGGWAAMIQHYFLAAWIPPEEQRHRYTTRQVGNGQLPRYLVAATSPQISVPAGERHTFTARLFAGPKLQNRLDEVAPGLRLTVDYRFFTIISRPLFWALDHIHTLIGHWGWSIVVLTLLIKLVFYKLTEAQFRSMGKLRKLQPRIQQLKERYGDDRQKFGQAMMEIYKKEKVNPLGGCLPILVQIPIFISLYWVLLESVELRQASFLWVPDLSQPDPYFILPILNGAFMIITQRLMPAAGMDPMQRKIMQGLPVVFAFLFALFPAGLVLYWATNAGVSLAQQWYILRRLDKEEERKRR